MKITAILLLAASLSVSAKGKAQITLSEKNAPLQKVFKEIQRQSGYEFLYPSDLVQKAGTVTIEIKDANIEEALKIILTGKPLSYTISDHTIVIKEGVTINEVPIPPPPIDVRGRVVNEKGEPVAGASVQVKDNKTKGTTTDENGYFILKGVDENAVLVISGVNIESFEVKVEGKANLETLGSKTKVTVGDEVLINTGYQKLKPNEITGSVSHLNNEQVNRAVSTDVLARLKGMASGVLFLGGGSINNTTDRGNIQIRSLSTIFSRSDPLIILDEFPFEDDLNTINPNDVESITVLKDAAAASIWGTRAGNGVIVITTKVGKYNQRLKINMNTNITWEEKPDLFYTPHISSSEFIEMEEFLYQNGHYNNTINSLTNRGPLSPAVEIFLKRTNGQISAADSALQINALKGFDIRNDLLNYYYRRPLRQQYSLGVTGGGSNHNYYVSAGFDKNLNPSADFNRATLSASHNYAMLNKRIQLSTGVNLAQQRSTNYESIGGLNYPYARLADEMGNPLSIPRMRQSYIDTAGGGKLLDWNYFPLKEIGHSTVNGRSFSYRVNAALKLLVTRGVDITLSYQRTTQDQNNMRVQDLQSYYTRNLINNFTNLQQTVPSLRNPVPIGDILDRFYTLYISRNARAQINIQKKIGMANELSALMAGEISENTSKSNANRYYGYQSDIGVSLPVDYINTYPNYISGSRSSIPHNESFGELSNRFISVLGNAAFVHKKKYIISASFRRDGSNIFGASTNNKWKPQWSLGASWDVRKEKWFKIKWLSELKWRTTYGFQGNVTRADIAALLTIYHQSSLNRWGLPFAFIQNSPNPDLRWEKVGQLNIAIDFTLVKNIFSGTIEYFRKHGTDLIGDKELPPSSGTSATKTNSANMKGEGIDMRLSSSFQLGKIRWSVDLLFGYNRDWVSEYKIPTSGYVNTTNNPIIGKPIRALYSYKWAGLEGGTGDPLGYLNGQISKDYGAIRNSQTLDNVVYHGTQTAPYHGSFINNITWKQLSLSFNFIYKFGYYFRRPSIDYTALVSGSKLGHPDYSFRWRNPGDEKITQIPSFIYPTNDNRDYFYTYSEILVEKGDHIRLNDIRVSYDINKSVIPKLPVKNIQLYLYASNLGLIWRANKAGIDPDYIPSAGSIFPSLLGKTFSIGLRADL